MFHVNHFHIIVWTSQKPYRFCLRKKNVCHIPTVYDSGVTPFHKSIWKLIYSCSLTLPVRLGKIRPLLNNLVCYISHMFGKCPPELLKNVSKNIRDSTYVAFLSLPPISIRSPSICACYVTAGECPVNQTR